MFCSFFGPKRILCASCVSKIPWDYSQIFPFQAKQHTSTFPAISFEHICTVVVNKFHCRKHGKRNDRKSTSWWTTPQSSRMKQFVLQMKFMLNWFWIGCGIPIHLTRPFSFSFFVLLMRCWPMCFFLFRLRQKQQKNVKHVNRLKYECEPLKNVLNTCS